jgi:3-hydroxyacyl-[acyl-carrier-protein] dehydratase
MLYSILSIEKETDENTKIEVELNPQHAIFGGHFPGNPVLPGACMVQMMRELLQDIHHCKLELQKSQNIKFISVVIPGVNNLLTFNIQAKSTPEGSLYVKNTIYAGDITCMKFSGVYKIKK